MRIPQRSLDLIRERSGNKCELCGKDAGQSSHRRPKGMGGSRDPVTNSPANLLRVCGTANVTGSCHELIEMHRERSLAEGWLVRQCHDPRTIPVHLSVGWVYLTEDGRYVPKEDAA